MTKQQTRLRLIMPVLLFFCGVFAASPLDASELFGKITYKGVPLKNAEIVVKDKTIKTNEIGYYSVNLDPGACELAIKLPDGSVKREKVDVFPQDTEKNLKLE